MDHQGSSRSYILSILQQTVIGCKILRKKIKTKDFKHYITVPGPSDRNALWRGYIQNVLHRGQKKRSGWSPAANPSVMQVQEDSGLRGVVNFQICLQKIKELVFLTRLSAMKGRSKRRRKGNGEEKEAEG